ncbi:MAG: UPF0182 family protein [Propionibacteriales bacterium]|nr:UPF0182 family protein [Propionibacteriales bacterium]
MNAKAPEVRRNALIPSLLVLIGLVIVWVVFSGLWADKLWFDSVNYPQVFDTLLTTKVMLFFAYFSFTAVVLGLNLWLAFRMRPKVRRGGQSQLLDRYRALLESRAWWVIAVPSVVLGLMAAGTGVGEASKYLAFFNRQPFGTVDPYFGMDVSFYVFEYPVWTELLSLAMSTVVFALVAVALVHFATGALLVGQPRGSSDGRARMHLSILAGIALVIFGLGQLLSRYGLLTQRGSLLTGMQYTEDHAQVTAKLVLAVIAFIVAALFFANGFLRRLVLPLSGLVLLVVTGIIIGLIYPAVVRSFQVLPNEPDKERPYIAANIAATRTAFGIADTEVSDYDAVVQVSPGQLKNDAAALPGIRLMDPAVVGDSFDQLQQVRSYYSFAPLLDVDRYQIKGVETDVVVAAREIDLSKLPDKSWNNLHTVFTHGYGLVAAYGNKRSSSGDPVWIDGNLPPSGELGNYEGRIYFGENTNTFAVVGDASGQKPVELDTPGGGSGGNETYNTYAGSGGVPIGSPLNRAIYATQFGDMNLLLSDRVNSASKILYQRTPKERVAQVAPWLQLDSNIYPAVVGSRLVWIVDGYTMSANYPNSQTQSLQEATADSQSSLGDTQPDVAVNYLRNSVKAVVDASDGSVTLYAWDTDPILATYMKAFPGVVKPKDAISPELLAHLRYPTDLFKLQRQVLARYHMTDPSAWYQQSDLWQTPTDPSRTSSTSTTAPSAGPAEPPYYLSIKWPGDKAPVFSQTAVFVPKSRSNLASYFAVVSEATSPDYGKLRVLRMSGTHQVDGPGQTFNNMVSDTRFAELLRNYTSQGSADSRFGNLLTLPMGNGLLYVMPIYTLRQSTTGAYPSLRFVAVRFGSSVGIGETLQAALDSAFAGNAGASTGEGGGGTTPTQPTQPTQPPTGTDPSGAAADLATAQAAFNAADAALKNGNLAEYQKQVDAAKAAVLSAMKKLGR